MVVVFTNCIVISGGGSGGGGSGGGWNGGGSGGGGGSNTWTNTSWQYIYNSNIPIHLFVQGGGVLPAGLTIEMAEKLRQLNNICHFSASQLDWMAHHSNLINLFLAYLSSHDNLENAAKNLKDLITALQQNAPPPNNTPISVADPICPDIFTFKTFKNEVTGQDAAAMILHNSYFQFNVPGSSSPAVVHFWNLRFEAYANANGTCLNSYSVAVANAINTATVQVQQFVNNLPSGTSLNNSNWLASGEPIFWDTAR